MPVYVPIAGLTEARTLARICREVADAGLDGALITDVGRTTPEQQAAIRNELTKRLAIVR